MPLTIEVRLDASATEPKLTEVHGTEDTANVRQRPSDLFFSHEIGVTTLYRVGEPFVMADRILVPYDGTPQATEALELTFDEFPDATVIALYVIEVPDGRWAQLLGPELQVPVSEKAEEHAADVLETATDLATEYGRSLETNIVTGEPDDRIVAQAAEESVDLIVIGSHSKEGVSRVLLGSVAETVVRRSPVPVLVVR